MGTAPPKKPAAHEKGDLVLTPGGWRQKSKVHAVKPGQHVSGAGGRLRIIDTATGQVIEDLGEAPDGVTNTPHTRRARSRVRGRAGPRRQRKTAARRKK